MRGEKGGFVDSRIRKRHIKSGEFFLKTFTLTFKSSPLKGEVNLYETLIGSGNDKRG